MILVDQTVARERMELGDPHWEHSNVHAPHVLGWRPAVQLVRRDQCPAFSLAEKERVHVVLGQADRVHDRVAEPEVLAGRQFVDPHRAETRLHVLELVPEAEPLAEVDRDLRGQVDLGRRARRPRPGAPVDVHLLEHAAAGSVVGMPMGVGDGGDAPDLRAVELALDLLRGVDQQVGAVHEDARPAPAVRDSLGARLDADSAVAERPRRGASAARAEELDSHPCTLGARERARFDGRSWIRTTDLRLIRAAL